MELRELLDQFNLQLRANGRSEHTVVQHQRYATMLETWLVAERRSTELRDIDPAILALFLTSPIVSIRRGGGRRKTSSANCIRSSLRNLFAFARDAGFVDRNAAALVRRARCGTAPPRTLSEDDQRRLLYVLRQEDKGRDYALIHTLLATGLRISSALALHVEDLDLVRGEAHVRKAKGNRPTTAVLGRAICDHLRQHLAGRTCGPVFTGKGGAPMTSRQATRRLKHWAARAGIESGVSCHVLRHCHGMAVYRKTGDLLLTQMALGHASVVSTTVYARADQERLRAVLEA